MLGFIKEGPTLSNNPSFHFIFHFLFHLISHYGSSSSCVGRSGGHMRRSRAARSQFLEPMHMLTHCLLGKW